LVGFGAIKLDFLGLIKRTGGAEKPVEARIARILAFLAFFNFFLYSVDRRAAKPPGHAGNGAGVRLDPRLAREGQDLRFCCSSWVILCF
jgi:hypothetical protein